MNFVSVKYYFIYLFIYFFKDLTLKLTELEKKLKEEEKLEMKKVSGIKALKDSITSEENKKKQLGKNLKEVKVTNFEWDLLISHGNRSTSKQ